MTYFRCLLLAFVLIAFTGCTGGNFLVGKWVFDEEATLESITSSESVPKPPSEGPAGGLLGGIVGGLQKGFSVVIAARFEGTEFEFTRSEMRRIRGGTGESEGYTIIERPESGVYLVETEDGDISTWAKTETGIRMKLPGEGDAWVHFRPAE